MNIPPLLRSFPPLVSSLDPARWWVWGVRVFIGGIILLVAWSASVYLRVAGGGAVDADATQQPPLIDQASLRAVRSVLDSRAVEEQKYKTGAYSYKDPSQ